MKLAIYLFSVCIFLSGCVSLHTVSLTTIPAKRDRKVTAEASRFIILGFNFDNDFVDNMTQQLKEKCPNGMISGILTKDESVNYFLYLFWSHRVTATGYCNSVNMTKLDSNHRTPSSEDSESEL